MVCFFKSLMFKPSRIFAVKNLTTGKNDWYFQAREGNIGPFTSSSQAEYTLERFVQHCIELGQTGGRSPSLGMESEIEFANYMNYGAKGDINWV